jgi:dTMP kinase
MKLICLTGIDGSGKTTITRKLVEALNDQGYPAVYVYGRTDPFISRFIMNMGRSTILRQYNQWAHYDVYHSSKKRVMRNPLLRWIYTGTIWLDYYLQASFKLLPMVFSRKLIILDRYVYDTIISDLAVHLEYSHSQISQLIRRSFFLLPKPTLTFLIDLPAEIAFARKNDVPHLHFLSERRNLYLELLRRPEVIRLNGEESIEKLVENILSTILLKNPLPKTGTDVLQKA